MHFRASTLVLLLNTTLALVIHKRAARRATATLTLEEHEVVHATTAGVGGADLIVVLAGDAEAEEEQDGRNEHGGPGAPGEAEGVAADRGIQACGAEGVAGLYELGAVDVRGVVWRRKGGLRHEGCGEGEPEEREGEKSAGEGGCETAAGSERRGQEGHGCEEEGDQVENPAESPEVVVVGAGGVLAVGAAFY